jgi:acyl transferase domain-containing protein
MRGGHFLKDDVTAFDAPFFSITIAETEAMDPQQRLLLETTYRAIENGI